MLALCNCDVPNECVRGRDASSCAIGMFARLQVCLRCREECADEIGLNLTPSRETLPLIASLCSGREATFNVLLISGDDLCSTCFAQSTAATLITHAHCIIVTVHHASQQASQSPCVGLRRSSFSTSPMYPRSPSPCHFPSDQAARPHTPHVEHHMPRPHLSK